MMKKSSLLQMFNRDTIGENHIKGKRVFENDLVESIDIVDEENIICIDGNVISENLFNEYKTTIEMDIKGGKILYTYCTCADYKNNGRLRKNYSCKHVVGTFYKALEEIGEEDTKIVDEVNVDALALLLPKEKEMPEVKIEVYINKDRWNGKIFVEFKIGLKNLSSNKLYVLRDINQFLVAVYNKIPIKYSENFSFNLNKQRLSTKDKVLLEFIEMLKKLESSSKEKIILGKYIYIPDYFLRDFFKVISNHRVYLNEGFFNRPVDGEISFDIPMIDFDMKLIGDKYVLKCPSGMAVPLNDNGNVFIYGTTIIVPPYDFCYSISNYLKIFSKCDVITIPIENEERVLRELIPSIKKITKNFSLSKKVQDKIVDEPVKFNFYFDRENEEVTLTLKVTYGMYQFNILDEFEEKIIYRDKKSEEKVMGTLRTLGFEVINNKFHIIYGDDYIFNFFKYKINILQDIGEVYYSENFKGIKSIGSKFISGEIAAGKYDYFEMKFKLGDISEGETKNILRAFRDNVKYYKLDNGEFLDIEEIEMRRFLKLLDAVAPYDIEGNEISIPKNKGIFLNNYLEENNIKYIKGKPELSKLKKKFEVIGDKKFKVPKEINGVLREYQVIGFKWMKTIEELGFGGILGDEMGLGKTIQAITFISAGKGKKSLVVTPTSLIYNWKNEFVKFNPTLKVAINNGDKDTRKEMLKKSDDYDVIITTYNLLKSDIDYYKSMEFDYFILDEAQYIKNFHSQNSKMVKTIKAKVRFALTGTPMENSLMELWSIFDFIMPGYLYDEKTFSVRYHKKFREDKVVIEELNKLIEPFILRRKKSEVVKELPEKIEKIVEVELEEEQKKVYGVYSKYATELIEKKVKDGEFESSKIEILSYITKLRQIALDPSVTISDYDGGSGKIEALMELLHHAIEEGHKILVFSQFTAILLSIARRLEGEKIDFSYLDGSIPAKKRMAIVDDFNNGDNSVFLISLKAGGTGLNLTSADVVVHFDPWWNPAVENQATDRAHRIGQENIVEVIKLVARGTIEEKIVKLQKDKERLIEKVIDEGSSSENLLQELDSKKLMEMLEFDI